MRRPTRCARCSARTGSSPEHRERVLHAAGKGYPDLVRLRAGTPGGSSRRGRVPAQPRAAARATEPVRERVDRASCRSGAGTSVVGGVAPRARASTQRCSRSTWRGWPRCVAARRRVRDGVGAGRHARACARALPAARWGSRSGTSRSPTSTCRWAVALPRGRRGRHRPGYGAIEEMVAGAARGRRRRGEHRPAARCRRALRARRCASCCVGSEGVLGVISEVRLRVREAPAAPTTRACSSRTWRPGVEAYAHARARARAAGRGARSRMSARRRSR